MHPQRLLVAVFVFISMSLSVVAVADTVTFNAGVIGTTSYTEAGMVFESLIGEALDFASAGPGDVHLINDRAGNGMTIHLTDFSPFSLISFDIFGGGPSSMDFYSGATSVAGISLGGGHMDFTGDPRFSNITSISWCGQCFTDFDWVQGMDKFEFTRVSSVPEPGSVALLASGLAVALFRRKQPGS